MNELKKIIVILGPTASGKTALSLRLAKKFDGEIVNADSRQIYKEMNIGTDKPEGEWKLLEGRKVYAVQGVPHHLIGIIELADAFSLADYKEMAMEAIKDVLKRGKLPIIVGGTGLYISSVVDNLDIPKVAPSRAMRSEFEKKSLAELVNHLKKLDPEAAEKIDLKNPRRVIRALEVAIITGLSFSARQKKLPPLYDALEFALDLPKEELARRADERVDSQIRRGLVGETEELMKKYREGFWIFPSLSAISYREVGHYLRGETTLDEAVVLIKKKTRDYAKRQMTWFKKDKRITWIKSDGEADKIVTHFLSALHRP